MHTIKMAPIAMNTRTATAVKFLRNMLLLPTMKGPKMLEGVQ